MGEVDPLEQERLARVTGQGVGEAVAEVESRGVPATAPEVPMSVTGDPRLRSGDRDHLDLLCRAGAVAKVRAGIVAMEGNFGLAQWYRRAIERKEAALEEHA